MEHNYAHNLGKFIPDHKRHPVKWQFFVVFYVRQKMVGEIGYPTYFSIYKKWLKTVPAEVRITIRRTICRTI